ncbi:AraC family transcriptional regulator [Aeromicrobium camelliae]|uniref:AraC family transcriptional regulator n=2 Tax=Aeromicrobium camelliae TaxID=1538144 RepID=A0A3N6W460_9ACTN|nr:AraC family transcriptional regulator [Aeromicrobium camelliae]
MTSERTRGFGKSGRHSAAATTLAASKLFGNAGVPVRVLESISSEPSGPVSAESVKVIFMVVGWAEIRSAEESIAASSGTILTLPAGLECSGTPRGLARTVTFYAHPDYLHDQVRWLGGVHPLVYQLHGAINGDTGMQQLQLPANAMRALAPRLVHLSQLPRRSENEFAMLSAASDVFAAVGRYAGVPARRIGDGDPTQTRPRAEVIAATDLMRGQISRTWSMETLAREVALSPSQLRRLFNSQVGVSPAAYLARLRAEKMAELLATTSMGVTQAARESGWRDATVAARNFKKRYGVSPREYAASFRVRDRCSNVDCRSCGPA